MAVQAQYPSNILFLNRNAQEPHDYSLQAQQGLYLDQSHMLFNNGVGGNSTNQRKRGRETSVGTDITPSMIPFSLQPPQLIDLSQLHNHNHNHNHHPNVVSTGLRLSFGDQQQQFQQHHHNQQQQQQQQQQDCHSSSSLLSVLAEDFASQIKQQRDELDQFLQAQGEQLQRTLAEKRQTHYRALLGAAEESISRKLREKEAEVQKATRRNAELEARAAQLSVEAQIWQAKARAQEATAASLQVQVQQAKAMMSAGFQVAGAQDSRRADDGLTCAENQAEDAESGYIDPERATGSGPSCKACRKGVASVVLLPCRHLCLCTECDQMVQSCPLCLTLRNSSVEVFLC
ncbi:putative transcription factor C2H2 family [Rosa chinensis]|uniref:Putative transcription factor C2H2 family n=1 Tax=Rosa chinensis TaxID=74649 RepID=A0A2P6P9L3_ROSCH|nr:E3 ubiquitin-protein ligase BOI [Rosa chinensis]PRQ18602.1 putative transcription factor C2H2 family [Rosa chinensis]